MEYFNRRECSSLVTTARILNLLNAANIVPNIVYPEMNQQNDITVYYCSVFLGNGLFFSNGKALTQKQATTCGLAEFMERLQNFSIKNFKDEKLYSVSEYNKSSETIKFADSNSKKKNISDIDYTQCISIKNISKDFYNSKKIKCIEYYSSKNNSIVYIPDCFKKHSNGMCAGNTPEEAIIEGISEIFERYVLFMTCYNNYVFPNIPQEEYIKYDNIRKLIEMYNNANIEVIIKDASLGKNIPVVCVILRSNNKYTIHFSSHPILPIAIEKTLLEIAQGAYQKGRNKFYRQYIWQDVNTDKINLTTNMMDKFIKYGYIKVNNTFFDSNSFYQYSQKNWYNDKFPSNKKILKYLIEIIQKNNFDLYIRDSSFLGFPTYHVFIPQCAMSYKLLKKICKNNLINVQNNTSENKLYSKIYKTYLKNIPNQKNIKNIINGLIQ